MSKRGTDHTWKLVKYNGDASIYARCKCKYHYCCSTMKINKDGSRNVFHQVLTILYPYCPVCGVRKKWYSTEITKIDKYEFEDI